MTTRATDYTTLLTEIAPRPIRSAAEYRRRLRDLEDLMSRRPSPATSSMIEMLSLLIAAYEAEKFPLADAPPEAVLDHLIENGGRSPALVARELDMAPSTLSNYRKGRRKLSLERIKQFAEYFGVPPAVFMG
jgi:antitoxin component HigA of HigAB toxin-antitoxin module